MQFCPSLVILPAERLKLESVQNIDFETMNEFKIFKSKILEKYHKIEFAEDSCIDDLTLTFSNSFQTEFYFVLTISKSLEFASIGACLNNAPKNQYFWFTDIDII